ncbi:MAG TPA: ATP-dependent helicase [Thermoanaerobaculia bacterium]|nr:ATP-dependent helicase [Thermoanaerobaculia bacterium]
MTLRPQDVQAAQAVQTAAARAPEAQVRLVAGPGSGKSSAIEERVRWLLEQGVEATAIAVVSFTNASVIDLRLRLHAYCLEHQQPGIVDVSITTLHSLALRLLRQAGLLEMYPTRPLVLDDWELENIYDAEFGEAEGINSKPRREKIRRFYEALWSTGVPNAPTYVAPDPPISDAERQHFDVFHQPTAQVYSAVLPGEIVRNCVQATVSGLMDPAQLLRIQHLVVDEYQDLNPADLEFVDQLAAAGVTIFVAGDDDQSIYSFRHASPIGIQRFTERYPAAAAHALQHCFRCTPTVLAAATRLILSNASPSRIPKTLVSLYRNADPPNAGVVLRWRFPTADQEAAAIALSCGSLIQAGLSPREILILLVTRDNRVALWPRIKEALEQAGVPFDPPKEEGFSGTDIGRLVLAVTRVVCSRDEHGNTEDLVALRTILGLKRRVGIGTCNRIRAFVIETPNVSFRDLFYADLPNGLPARAIAALDHARTNLCYDRELAAERHTRTAS